ncbi:hypothetical protein C8R45DRAFT_1040467 [Mycena sanguinolenta]|nr:hypothetical protein C8R45DRAFT_1040467 [Mycena sanguinolenta]
MYSARIRGCQSKMTVAVYQGTNAEREWLEDISPCTLARHPNIIQLFGTTISSGLYAGIFHDELIPYMHLLENHCHFPVWTVYFWGFAETEFFVRTAALITFCLPNVDFRSRTQRTTSTVYLDITVTQWLIFYNCFCGSHSTF